MQMTRRAGLFQQGPRYVILLCIACFLFILFIVSSILLVYSRDAHIGYSYPPPLSRHNSTGERPDVSVFSLKGDWQFDATRDDRDYGLSDGQCNGAFPEYFYEIERAMSWQQEQEQPLVNERLLETSWRPELMRLMIYDKKLYMIDVHWSTHGYDLPRAIALLQQIHRAIVASSEALPNIEFVISLADWPKDPGDQRPLWVLTRHKDEQNKWVMPDFGYWSWPLKVVGDYTQFRKDVRENELDFEDKIQKAVWRGATNTNKLREDLVRVASGHVWSDVHAVEWINITTMTPESYRRSLTMADHCNYQFLMHTEGHTYSGRGKYLLNCQSVSIVHKTEWIEPHTHLMIASGSGQNIIEVERDFSDLEKKMKYFMRHEDQSQAIAQRSTAAFRDRYLSPAAQACYWRKMFRAWASVSHEPELYHTVRDNLGKVRRRSRGVPFETFVASLALP